MRFCTTRTVYEYYCAQEGPTVPVRVLVRYLHLPYIRRRDDADRIIRLILMSKPDDDAEVRQQHTFMLYVTGQSRTTTRRPK